MNLNRLKSILSKDIFQDCNNKLPGIVLLFFSILLSLCVYQDYGVSWDEVSQREIGMTSYNYIFHNDNALKTYIEKDHGTGIELPLVILEKITKRKDSSDIYLMRHLVGNILFLFSVFIGYLLALRLFKNQWLALLFFILVAFNPRFYAHSFFNSKDIPFLSLFILVFFVAEIAFRKNKWQWHILLGVICGYTTSVRILALILLAIFSLFYFIDFIKAFLNKKNWKNALLLSIAFLFAYCSMLYISWPVLWTNPLTQFVENFKSMSHFRWKGAVLFFGETYKETKIPWTYIPGWFLISIPELWVILGVAGLMFMLKEIVTKSSVYFLNAEKRNYLLYLLCFLTPPLMVISLKSVVLDDWRHLYFIYAGFVFLLLYLLQKILELKWKNFVIAICLLQLMDTALFFIKYHPFQQVYFNHFVSHETEFLRKNFDLDYWGCSFNNGYHYLLQKYPNEQIKIDYNTKPLINNTLILNAHDRERIFLADDSKDATFFLSIFRNHPNDYPEKGNVEYEIKVLNSTIMRIQKLPK